MVRGARDPRDRVSIRRVRTGKACKAKGYLLCFAGFAMPRGERNGKECNRQKNQEEDTNRCPRFGLCSEFQKR
jgi:hypothetical protein